jgi:hypothetical protein
MLLVMGEPEDKSTPDFLLEWYKLQRAHELELNKATLAYELELAKLLVLLNGGAAGAFLTLLGAVSKDRPLVTSMWTGGAILAWLIGLLVATSATHEAYEIQSGYSKAYRLRRQGEELRRIQGSGIKASQLGIEKDEIEELIKEADNVRTEARARSENIWVTRYLAVALFLLGGFFGLLAVYGK